jgi:hypothetical protein
MRCAYIGTTLGDQVSIDNPGDCDTIQEAIEAASDGDN